MRRRTKHSLSHYKLATFDMGELVPVGCVEVLPGDSFQHASSVLLRVSPLLAPVMHPISVRVHHFFVPNRLLWDGWEDFITGGDDGEGGDSGAYPTITVNTGTGWAEGSLADYLGIPTGVDDLPVSALPFRAYAAIFNEYYRDQDLVTELTYSTGSGADTTTNTTLQRIAWEKDYFTAARPWPQKGPDVTLPLGTVAPIVADGNLTFTSAGGGSSSLAKENSAGRYIYEMANSIPHSTALRYAGGLEADLEAATGVNVTEVRRMFALQRYQEARAMYGSEYVDYLRYAFGVTSSDARLQRPEYLGGGKQTIAFSEVLQTGPDTEDEGVASLKGHGIAAMRSRRYRRFFEEHGYVISLMSVRPRSMYGTGLHRAWSRTTKEDYFQQELEFIGQQEVLNKEVYAAHATPGGTFGYQDRYSEYRHLPSYVSGEFRSTLNYWHLARLFASDPALNSTFVTCNPGKRINAEQTTDQLWVMVNHSLQARRQVSQPSIGRIL